MGSGTKPRTPVVLLSAHEALSHAAEHLEQMLLGIMLCDVLSSTVPRSMSEQFPADVKEQLATVRAGLVDPSLQKLALEDAIKEIRALALEKRLFAARREGAQA